MWSWLAHLVQHPTHSNQIPIPALLNLDWCREQCDIKLSPAHFRAVKIVLPKKKIVIKHKILSGEVTQTFLSVAQ